MNEMITPEHHLPTGTILNGRYEIIRTLGEGGFGITYMGHNIVLDILVAIKEYYPHGYANRSASHDLMVTITDTTKNAYFSTWKDKFLEEAKTLSKFEKIPNIVNVLDFFEQNGTAYIVMEYLSGVTLSNFVKVNGPFKANDLCAIMIPLLRSLDRIHQEKLIHRDISPDNIMVMEDGSLKLYDFGASREYSEESQKSLSIMLKPGYAPEEQYRSRGNQGPWTDIYAACATMYFCITGVRPDDSVQRVFSDELKAPSELGVSISLRIEEAIMIGMSVRAEDRFQSAKALANALERALKLSAEPDIAASIIKPDDALDPHPLSQSSISEDIEIASDAGSNTPKKKINLHAMGRKIAGQLNGKVIGEIIAGVAGCAVFVLIVVNFSKGVSNSVETSSASSTFDWSLFDSRAQERYSSINNELFNSSTSRYTYSYPNTNYSKPFSYSLPDIDRSVSTPSSDLVFSTPDFSSLDISISSPDPTASIPNNSNILSDTLLVDYGASWRTKPKFVEKADRLECDDEVILKGSVSSSMYDSMRYNYQVRSSLADFDKAYDELYDSFSKKIGIIMDLEETKKSYSSLDPLIDKCLSELSVIKQYSYPNSVSTTYYDKTTALVNAWEEYFQSLKLCSSVADFDELSELISKRDKLGDNVVKCDEEFWNNYKIYLTSLEIQSELYWREYGTKWANYVNKLTELAEYMDSIDSITEENMKDHLEKVRSMRLMLTWDKAQMNGYVVPYGMDDSIGVIFDLVEKGEVYADACQNFFSSPYSIAVMQYAQKIDDSRAELADAYSKAVDVFNKIMPVQ